MHFENKYLVIDDNDKIYDSKIFTSRYPTLLGANDFQKPGDALLEMWRLIPKEPFDEFYTLRGEIAELKVERAFVENGRDFKHFGSESSKKKIFDVFNDNKVFGGAYDFLVKGEDNTLINVEVKSTNIKNKPYLKEPRKEHVKQAQLSSFLGRIKHCKIIYVFFNDQDEETIREMLKNKAQPYDISSFRCEYKTFEIEIDEDKIKRDMMIVYDLVNECKKNRRIPIALISDNVLAKLGYKANIFERAEFKI